MTTKYYLHHFHKNNYWPSINMSHNDEYLHITFFIIDFIIIMYKSEIEVADFDRLLAKIEHVPMENPAMRELLIKV